MTRIQMCGFNVSHLTRNKTSEDNHGPLGTIMDHQGPSVLSGTTEDRQG